jgi:hypothetical protein
MNENLKGDLRLEFENWLNNWQTNAYRVGVTVPDIIP